MNFRKTTGLVFIILLAAGCGLQLSPSKDPWFAQHYYIMQDFERAAYKNLSSAAKLEFQTLFWEVRTPISKQEFDKRMGYIADNFKKENFRQPWNTDRARVYLLNGPPAEIDSRQNDSWTIQNVGEQSGIAQVVGAQDRSGEDVGGNWAEIWTYPFGQFMLNYVFTFSRPNSWKINTTAFQGNRYIGQFELKNKLETYSIVDENAYKERLEALKAIK
jgi:GWxTD domain-containing protein